MIRYIVRRLLGAIPVLFGLSIVLFAFVHLLPGDPCSAILGQHRTEEACARLRANLGLDDPLTVQYLRYLGSLLRGDLGASVINNKPFLDEFLVRFPGTIELTLGALVFAVGLGIPLGRLAARHAQSWLDGVVTAISLFGISIPVFVLGLVLVVVFGVGLGWLPTQGRIDARLRFESVTNFMLIDTLLAGRPDLFVDAVRHLILPSIALGSIPLAIITRITRASVIEVSHEDYVRTARAKGLTERRVDERHIMRNAWLPVTTVIGLQVGGLLAGAVLTETVFVWNGVGRWVVDAIGNRDLTIVQSTILVFALIFLVVNLIVDIGYAFLNPRIRYA
ncbi:MAG: peptide ABC transporter permease [Chloroflexota bacterium]|nr:MAG: peptide ABC transporter permease [Chloroflexota bacterium]HWP63745.1 ABC transporter permease [Candidatus Binatia bacterium]